MVEQFLIDWSAEITVEIVDLISLSIIPAEVESGTPLCHLGSTLLCHIPKLDQINVLHQIFRRDRRMRPH